MSCEDDNVLVPISYVLSELGEVIGDCEATTSALEIALSAWSIAHKTGGEIPIHEMQSIDHLRQTLGDLAAFSTQLSKTVLGSEDAEKHYDISTSLEELKLGGIRHRFAARSAAETPTDSTTSNDIHHPSDVQFFL